MNAHIEQRRLISPLGDATGAAVTNAHLQHVSQLLITAQRTWSRRRTPSRAECIATLAAHWLDSERMDEVIAVTAPDTTLSPGMLRWGFQDTLSRWTQDALMTVVHNELGRPAALDDRSAPSRAVALRRCTQVLARTVPPAGMQSVMWAWLVGSAVWVRPAHDQRRLWRVWLQALRTLAPELAALTAVFEFDAADLDARQTLTRLSDLIVVHGSDATIEVWRGGSSSPPVVGYGHRLSAAFVSADALAKVDDRRTALRGIAEDLCAWDQTGCLSPVVLFVEQPAVWTMRQVAEALVNDHLPEVAARWPPGAWSVDVLAERTHTLRSQLFAASHHGGHGADLLVYDEATPLRPGCLHRVLPIQPVRDTSHVIELLSAWRPHLQALAIAGPEAMRQRLGDALVHAGLNRVCRPGQLQRPPLGWRHDGVGTVAPLVRWLDRA